MSNTSTKWDPRALLIAMRAAECDGPSDLARRLSAAGLPAVRQTVQSWLEGHEPRYSSIIRLADVLNVRPDFFYSTRSKEPAAAQEPQPRPPPGG